MYGNKDVDVQFTEKLVSMQKQCEKYEHGYTEIKAKSKELYSDFKKSLKENKDLKRTIEELKSKLKLTEKEVEHKEENIEELKNKISELKRTSVSLQPFKQSYNTIQSLNAHNDM